MRKLDSNFVAHEVTLVVLRDTFFCSLTTVEFNKAKASLELDSDDTSKFAKAVLEIFGLGVFGETADIDLVRLE